jgi:hypothetical protein
VREGAKIFSFFYKWIFVEYLLDHFKNCTNFYPSARKLRGNLSEKFFLNKGYSSPIDLFDNPVTSLART